MNPKNHWGRFQFVIFQNLRYVISRFLKKKKIRIKELLLRVLQKPQRIDSFHERTGKEPAVMKEVIWMFQFLRLVIIYQKLVLWLFGNCDYVPLRTALITMMGLFQCCWLSNFWTKLRIWIKNIFMNKKRDGYVYLKSHIFSYIDSYVFIFFFPLCRLWIDDYWMLKNHEYALHIIKWQNLIKLNSFKILPSWKRPLFFFFWIFFLVCRVGP
jgi:hypothetical protein